MFRKYVKEKGCIYCRYTYTRIHTYTHTHTHTQKEKIFICAVKMIYVYIGDSRIYDASSRERG